MDPQYTRIHRASHYADICKNSSRKGDGVSDRYHVTTGPGLGGAGTNGNGTTVGGSLSSCNNKLSTGPTAPPLSHLSPSRLDATSGSLMAMSSLFANGDAASPISAGDLLLFNQQLDVVNRNLPSGSAAAFSSQTPQLDQRDPTTGRYVCKYCTYSTVQRTHLARHERSHTGERPFKCQFCPYSATLKTCLINHERTHTGEKPYKCKYCSYCASQKVTLERHQKTHFKGHQLSLLDAGGTIHPLDFSPENPSPPNV